MSCSQCVFPITNFLLDEGFKRCDEPPSSSTMQDSKCCGGEYCCVDCFLCFSLCSWAIDLVILPYSSVKYCKSKCKKEGVTGN